MAPVKKSALRALHGTLRPGHRTRNDGVFRRLAIIRSGNANRESLSRILHPNCNAALSSICRNDKSSTRSPD